MIPWQAFQVALIGVGCILVGEAISWFLVYRTDKYKQAKANVDRLTKKLQAIKDEIAAQSIPVAEGKKDKKKEKTVEDELTAAAQVVSFQKMTSTVAVSVFMLIIFNYLLSSYEGIVVAKIPFEPFGFVTAMSHRNIAGNDMTDAGTLFIFVLTSTAVRNSIMKLTGSHSYKDAPSIVPKSWLPKQP